ncbi:MAG: CRTAC1 family protein [Planctomycetes bacterium]|nr:CRTAC1 family protein [Planctomycetota bacterium]
MTSATSGTNTRTTRTRRAARIAAAALLYAGSASLGCNESGRDRGDANKSESTPAEPRQTKLFVDVTRRVKLDFRSACGPQRTYFMPEIMGSGGALLDYDNDGDLDIYLINAGHPPDATSPPAPPGKNRLFRQEPDHTFVDVTDEAGVGDTGYGMGVAVGDIDNDGFVDLYVTNYGPNVLYRNAGDGTFVNITEQAGVGDEHWGMSAAFVDFDMDGLLDLFVVNYVLLDPSVKCFSAAGRQDYCGPEKFPGAPDRLYRNKGNGLFEDVTAASGVAATPGRRGLGVNCGDLTGDGRIDIYVANDNQPNQLWVNQGDGTFVDDALLMGIAYDHAGHTEASMGVVCADLDNDSDLDLLLTHLRGEKDTLYRNEGGGFFDDASAQAGIVAGSMRFTSFGVAGLDYDQDGDLDLAIVSGHVFRGPVEKGANLSPFWNDYAQPGRLLANDGKGRFRDVSDQAGDLTRVLVGRGLAAGDLDGDGDQDLLITECCGPARVFYNECPNPGHWLTVRAFDEQLKRDMYGAVVTVSAGGRRLVRRVNPAYSYLSSGDPRAHFGLGEAERVDAIEVAWPGGPLERFAGGAADRVVTVVRGRGTRIRE